MGDGQWCCVSGCPSPHGEVYYSFPLNQSKMNAWLESIHGNEDVKGFHFLKARICSLHFNKENDYMELAKQDFTEMKLLPDAVPSIFPWKDVRFVSNLIKSNFMIFNLNFFSEFSLSVSAISNSTAALASVKIAQRSLKKKKRKAARNNQPRCLLLQLPA